MVQKILRKAVQRAATSSSCRATTTSSCAIRRPPFWRRRGGERGGAHHGRRQAAGSPTAISYDGVIQYAKWLAYLGDTLYEFTLRLNRHLNSLRARLGLPYWSLSQYPHRVKGR